MLPYHQGTINQRNIIVLNIYTSDFSTPNSIQSILYDFKIEVNLNLVTIIDFNSLLFLIYMLYGVNINRKTSEVCDIR